MVALAAALTVAWATGCNPWAEAERARKQAELESDKAALQAEKARLEAELMSKPVCEMKASSEVGENLPEQRAALRRQLEAARSAQAAAAPSSKLPPKPKCPCLNGDPLCDCF